VTYPEGVHGFDVEQRTAPARAIVRRTLRYLQARLAPPLRVVDACATAIERAGALRFFARDDTPLAGVVLGSGARGIVLGHGQGSDICEWLPYARGLAADGYRVLAYDARSGLRVDLDMAAAIEALRRTGTEHVVAMGSSMGAIAAIVGSASLAVPPAAVVSLSAPASFGPLHGLEAVGGMTAPIFFAASNDDDPFAGDARAMYAASASPDRRLVMLPGAVHGSGMLADPGFSAQVAQFLAAH
jgi:pimeloyl-ACP methyl ester carboxylesterase